MCFIYLFNLFVICIFASICMGFSFELIYWQICVGTITNRTTNNLFYTRKVPYWFYYLLVDFGLWFF
jgi:hypothetical protein